MDEKRFPLYPDVPSINEMLPEHRRIGVWMGFFGPPGLPKPMVARLNREIVSALKTPEVYDRLTSMGLRVIGDTSEEFGTKLVQNIEHVGRIVKAAGIKPE